MVLYPPKVDYMYMMLVLSLQVQELWGTIWFWVWDFIDFGQMCAQMSTHSKGESNSRLEMCAHLFEHTIHRQPALDLAG